MLFLRKKGIFGLFAIFFLYNQPTLGMQPQRAPRAPSTQLLATRLVAALGVGLAEGIATTYFTTQAMSLLDPVNSQLDETMFRGARFLIPGTLALGSYGLQKLAEYKERLSQIRTGRPSIWWSHTKSFFSSAKSLIVQNSIAHGLGSYLSQFYQGTGSAAAATCNALAPLAPASCSYIADKTAHAALMAVSLTATSGAGYVVSLVSGDDEPQLRVPKSSLMQLPCKAPIASAPPTTGAPLTSSIQIAGPQIAYFLADNGCDIEQLWHRFLSQAQQIKAEAQGNWQKLCAKQLVHLNAKIMRTFATTAKKLPTTLSSVTDLVNAYMPFGQYPEQFALNEEYRAQETPSFLCTVDKEPQAIFDGIRQATLSYLDPANLLARNQKGDEAIFNCPLTPIFISVDGPQVIITAYPQGRQDLLYQHQWESMIELPRWFQITSAVIPYAIMIGKIIHAGPSAYFTPDGTMCTMHDERMICPDGTSFPTTCTSHADCIHELLKKIPTRQMYLEALELDPQKTYTAKDIKKQHRKLARRYHPDKCQPKADCQEKFEQLTEAYEHLKKQMPPPETITEKQESSPQAHDQSVVRFALDEK